MPNSDRRGLVLECKYALHCIAVRFILVKPKMNKKSMKSFEILHRKAGQILMSIPNWLATKRLSDLMDQIVKADLI